MGNKITLKSHRLLVTLLFLIIAWIPAVYFYSYGLTDLFQFKQIAVVQIILESAHVLEYNPITGEYINAPGYIFEDLILSHVTGISPKELQFVPIQGLILPIIFYSLSKKITQKTGLAFIISITMIYGVPGATFYGIWSHGWAYVLYITLILLLCNYLVSTKKVEIMLLLLTITLAIHYFSYQVEMWCVVLTLFMVSFAFLLKRYGLGSVSLPKYLPIFLVVLMLGFSSIIYYNYLNVVQFDTDLFTVGIDSAFNKYFQLLFDTENQLNPYQYVIKNALVVQIKSAYLVALVLPVIVGLLYVVYSLLKNRSILMGTFSYLFLFSVIAVDVFFMIAYLAYGTLIFIHILFIYPLICAICLMLITKRMSLVYILSIVLAILAISQMGIPVMYGETITSPRHYTEFEPSADWLKEYTLPDCIILTDLRTGYKYQLEYSEDKQKLPIKGINLESYGGILGHNDLKGINFDYASVNMKFTRIEGMNWRQFAAFSSYASQIRNCESVNQVYDDGIVWHLERCLR